MFLNNIKKVKILNKKLDKIKEYLMHGVSNMIPYVIIGGIFTAFHIITGTMDMGKSSEFLKSLSLNISDLGKISFSLMIPILAGYISFSIGGMSALMPAIVSGFFSDKLKLGLFGGIIVGFLCGYIAKYINKLNFPPQFKILMPILIVPALTILSVCGIMYYLLGIPIIALLNGVEEFLKNLSAQNIQLLIIVLASMIAFDMGGPVNKAAYFFSYSMLEFGRSDIMGAVGVAICIPPLSLGIATIIFSNKYNEMEKEVGKAAMVMGMMGITEGAIPFAVMSPLKIIVSNIIGSVTGALFALNLGVKNIAPHGGFIVLPVVDKPLMYLISVILGVVIQILFLVSYEKALKLFVTTQLYKRL